MVVGNDDIDAQPTGFFYRRHAGDAAIDGDDQADALFFQVFNGGDLQTVPFVNAVGNIGNRLDIKGAQPLH